MTARAGTGAGPGGDPVRTRLAAAAAVSLTVGAGPGLRAVTPGAVAEYGGDALYTLLTVVPLVPATPRVAPLQAGTVALSLGWGIGFPQLSGLPVEFSRHGTAARPVLGSAFGAPDPVRCAVGAVVGRFAPAGRVVPGRGSGSGPGDRGSS
ncbi:DUF2809 domain-containing protein [Streptomyces sp. NPDC016640]|uniref:DUF2809 domain-containing protein n=1 Tax=Streptomyces sp. NPDC016640 TaxID=3364969 RepID=UPI0036FAB86A